MTLDEYQAAQQSTQGEGDRLVVDALGIAGEAGEVADLVKKHVGHGHSLDREKLLHEIGDVLWYVSALAVDVGSSLEEVAAQNIEKLRRRYPGGFDPLRSQSREDER